MNDSHKRESQSSLIKKYQKRDPSEIIPPTKFSVLHQRDKHGQNGMMINQNMDRNKNRNQVNLGLVIFKHRG